MRRRARRGTRFAVPATADSAGVVLGRIELERYRQTAAPADLADAIGALRAVDARPLDARERIELAVGMGEALYLDDHFGAAAALFESVLDPSSLLGPAAHERVLDWWATALDRQALARPVADRRPIYDRIAARMAAEIAKDAGSAPAGYWLAAATRGAGDLDGALNEATAGWVRAALAPRSRRRAAGRSRSADGAGHPARSRRAPARPRPRPGARRDGGRVGGVQGPLGALDVPNGTTPSQLFASFQFSPMPTSTVSGTLSATAPSIN